MNRIRRKIEFSKILAIWAILIASVSVIITYILAVLDHQTASDVTVAVFTGSIGYLISYAAKSATEKVSRNRHGLDKNGKPLPETNKKTGGVG